MKLARMLSFRTWKNPFGNLILLSFRKKQSAASLAPGDGGFRILRQTPRTDKTAA